jgi:uncharacterized protein (TIGR00266 family)
MQYQIRGTVLQTVDITLEAGESVFTQSGGMAWMTPNVDMSSEMKGGLLGALGRAVSGASVFLVNYTATGSQALVTFASEFPGHIVPLQLGEGQSMICQKEAFLVGQDTIKLETFFQRKLGAGLFGGEGFFLQKLTGPGAAFAQLSGEISEYNLEAGQGLRVDPGHVAMFEPTVSFDITMVKGIKNILFAGEGLFLADLRGPGRVWLQSMPLVNLARRLIPYLPQKSGS